jgi:hypothetical protein
MDYWKSKVLPKMKLAFVKTGGSKKAAAAELAKAFHESKVIFDRSPSPGFHLPRLKKVAEMDGATQMHRSSISVHAGGDQRRVRGQEAGSAA